MGRKIISIIFGSALTLTLSGVGLASATVIPPSQNTINVTESFSESHQSGHLIISVVTNGNTIVSMDPPWPGV